MSSAVTLEFTQVNDELEVYVNGEMIPWVAGQPDETRLSGREARLQALKDRATLGLILRNSPPEFWKDHPNYKWTQDLGALASWNDAGPNQLVLRARDTGGRGATWPGI